MQRYTFFYKGSTLPPNDLKKITSTPGVRVIDHEIDRAILVEAEEATIETLRKQLPGWLVSREVFYSRPEPQ